MSDKVTINQIRRMKKEGRKIAALTAYDLLFGLFLDEAEIDLVLVGDSVGMVFSGYESTVPVTLDEIIYHSKAVRRAVKRAFLVADLPFMSYQISPEEALRSSGRLMKECGAEAVKLEGGSEYAETVRRLVAAGIPVMGHLGMMPQSVNQLGGYKIQGKDAAAAEKIVEDAKSLEQAGAFAIVLEKIPAGLAGRITRTLTIPTIGIGAGAETDGQILVTHDMLGLFEKFQPKFVRRYANLADSIKSAVKSYVADVKAGQFPSEEESF
ncbi:MAG TPA: 3-methyl-2-oxobutanoate hydroxymethyltransferase [Candidatus Marinimicrobia bacterium]|nr:3-methyl-2-oxobutanoate hydroxymethyltransferase [Candidatus Neomarinimicrobiota bacterium]